MKLEFDTMASTMPFGLELQLFAATHELYRESGTTIFFCEDVLSKADVLPRLGTLEHLEKSNSRQEVVPLKAFA